MKTYRPLTDQEVKELAVGISAATINCLKVLTELPTHPERTRLGLLLIEANSIACSWTSEGSMSASEAVPRKGATV